MYCLPQAGDAALLPGPLSQQQGPAGCHQHLGTTQFSWGTGVRAILTHSVWVGGTGARLLS